MVKDPPVNAGDVRDMGSIPGWGRFPWRRPWQPTPVFLPGESHGQRSLEGYSPQGRRVKHNSSDLAAAAAVSFHIKGIFTCFIKVFVL